MAMNELRKEVEAAAMAERPIRNSAGSITIWANIT